MKFEFAEPLTEGLILNRRNRFVMEVLTEGKIKICHCPSTGKIGNIVFRNIPCLLSLTNNEKTSHTVEAISLSSIGNGEKKWIGINQIRANRYVEFLLKNNRLPKIIKINKESAVSRERTLGKSRLDFLINDEVWLEVKTPLIMLPLKKDYLTNKNVKFEEKVKIASLDRFGKHLDELTELSLNRRRSIMALFFMFEALPFAPPKSVMGKENEIKKKVDRGLDSGMEMWQINCKFDKYGVELADYYRILHAGHSSESALRCANV
ncbi:MAG: DNA/RNA nuclease SfsA [Rickettsiales bacterium]|jgi:sugar fermentation stimulation protein A|nr:DNA/RNA nuclease SfsA [Rickettsiales bacterium]